MSPAWIAAALTAAGIVTLAYMAPRASAAERDKPRPWRIERCHDGTCTLIGAYSGPTSCNVDLASSRIVEPAGTRLACVKMEGKP